MRTRHRNYGPSTSSFSAGQAPPGPPPPPPPPPAKTRGGRRATERQPSYAVTGGAQRTPNEQRGGRSPAHRDGGSSDANDIDGLQDDEADEDVDLWGDLSVEDRLTRDLLDQQLLQEMRVAAAQEQDQDQSGGQTQRSGDDQEQRPSEAAQPIEEVTSPSSSDMIVIAQELGYDPPHDRRPWNFLSCIGSGGFGMAGLWGKKEV
jgi:hypothetical protein